MLRHGWRTGAIVPELEVETKVANTHQFAQTLTWLQALTGLLERMQVHLHSKLAMILQSSRKLTRNNHNYPGSLFCTLSKLKSRLQVHLNWLCCIPVLGKILATKWHDLHLV